MNRTPNIPARFVSLTLAALLGATFGGNALAQSRYTLSTLQLPFQARISEPAFIDAQNRVVASVDYSTGLAFEQISDGSRVLVRKYASYPTQWRASAAASVSSTKLMTAKNLVVKGISPDGSKLVLTQATDGTTVVYDTASKRYANYAGNGQQSVPLGQDSRGHAINDAGWLVGEHMTGKVTGSVYAEQLVRATRWKPGQGGELLALAAPWVGSKAFAINAKGEVAGEVYEARTVDGRFKPLSHAAVWSADGQLTVLDTSEQPTSAVAIANTGKTVVTRVRPTDFVETAAVELHAQGQVEKLVPDGSLIPLAVRPWRGAISPDGNTVIVPRFTGVTIQPGRTLIYSNGELKDFSEVLAAKGAKLGAGNYIGSITSINANGSMTGLLSDAGNKRVQVRLNALP
jgi:hypothetical protein